MDDPLANIGMTAKDARQHHIISILVPSMMVVILVASRAWNWVPWWLMIFTVVVIVGSVWQSFTSAAERTAVYADRLETRRRTGVVAVVPRESVKSFRWKRGGDDGPYISVVDYGERKTKLLGTNRIGIFGWKNLLNSRRTKNELLVRLEHWKEHGSWSE
ncbi:hypothetical protein [Rhodococcus sp. 077-4]|uniref:hypothetical protein n=1 Tax=Rhodococcus sp. 077-4 TaxID=2789271 RepID=UPI0039F4B137